MNSLRLIIASNGVTYLQLRSVGSHSTSTREKEGRKKGRKEGREERRKEGRKERRKEGKKERTG
jgi:hypothetical protein